ncbi:hypothetical protein [Streptomyces afghaniensis]|nr:hypothetical protein [Streptomyces afghaniensis]MDQ1017620.1 hypothetical protein [Streptomyces afghaniensis]
MRLDRERLRALWSMPFQLFVHQLMYLVVRPGRGPAVVTSPQELKHTGQD